MLTHALVSPLSARVSARETGYAVRERLGCTSLSHTHRHHSLRHALLDALTNAYGSQRFSESC